MTLNRLNKHDVKIGDRLSFRPYARDYLITNVITAGNCVSFTLQDMETKQTIYAYPASLCYGAAINMER